MADLPPLPLLTETPEHLALVEHHASLQRRHLRELFAEEPRRAETFSAEAAGLYLDYSKNRITQRTLHLLHELARARGVEAARDAMLAGRKLILT